MSTEAFAPTRRSLATQAGALALLGAPASVFTLKDSAELRLLSLGDALDRCHAARLTFEIEHPDAEDDPFYDQHWDLRKRINSLRASTLEGLRVQARAAEYALAYDEGMDCHVPGSARMLAMTVAQTVQRLALTEVAA